ncbi:amino acid oxidase [Acidipropionibacterium timonense]|uniref:amino acid oxidase n=1 Tax=Acidipropionibacterium timonense TaxID=2161818 RepID=UPI00102F6EC2|nr:amino acid oxidase [Acidipropionibacterium timonense]
MSAQPDESTNYVGYDQTDNPSTGNYPTTPSKYFTAVKSGNSPQNDIHWNDSATCYTNGAYFHNSEGSLTPVTNISSGTNGSYASSSGFWWSVPTTSPQTGTGYIPGSTATLNSGATFVTDIEVIVPQKAQYAASHIMVNQQNYWTKELSGKLVTISGQAPYLASQNVAGNWSVTAPTTTTLPDGSLKVTGTLTYTTTKSFMVTQSKTKYYGQTLIMPATFRMIANEGWSSFSLTSYVQSATITYTGQPSSSPSSTTLTNQLLTTSKVVNKRC